MRYTPSGGGKTRIGYLSADFRAHAMANLMIDVFRRHDRERFEIFAFKLGGADDEMTQTLRDCFDGFVDVSSRSDAEAARVCREARLDVAVDLMGLTRASRPDILAHGAAPIQIGYLGYPGPIGDELIDYVIADEIVIPEAARPAFSERVLDLPSGYYPASHRALAANLPPPPGRAALGLPERGFVFCCFNNVSKINPETFDLWMTILRGAEGSVLWLLDEREAASERLRAEARARGVAPSRLVFAPKVPWLAHLARHRAADLFLDTLPYNAHTTAVDALWTGLPVLTRPGAAFAGRVGASLLTHLGMPEWIAGTDEAYVSRAVEWSRQPLPLAAVKAKLASRIAAAPLFDAARRARELEDAYLKAARATRLGCVSVE